MATVSRSLASRCTACQSECVDGYAECLDRADEGRRRCFHQGNAGWLAGWLASCCRRCAECSARSSKPADTHWLGPICWRRIQVSRTCPCKPWTWRHAGGLHISGPTGTETVRVRARVRSRLQTCARSPAARGAISSGAPTVPRVCSSATMRAHAQCPMCPLRGRSVASFTSGWSVSNSRCRRATYPSCNELAFAMYELAPRAGLRPLTRCETERIRCCLRLTHCFAAKH